MTKFYQIAKLEKGELARIRELEQELDRHIMAFEPGLDIAALSREQIARINDLEEELGVTLLVYER